MMNFIRQMYDRLIDRLSEAGYEQYEISNFAKLNSHRSMLKVQSPYRSQHNSSYWHNVPYIGIGASGPFLQQW